MRCVTCGQGKPGAQFWDGDRHHRSCLDCRNTARQIVERVAPYAGSIFDAAAKHPNSNIRLTAFAALTGDILFVIRQLPNPGPAHAEPR